MEGRVLLANPCVSSRTKPRRTLKELKNLSNNLSGIPMGQ